MDYQKFDNEAAIDTNESVGTDQINSKRESSSYGTNGTVSTSREDLARFQSRVPGIETRVYSRRYFMLFMFTMLSMCNAIQWIQYSIVAKPMRFYYNISDLVVDVPSLLYMSMYVIFVFPVLWIIEKKGLRVCLIIGGFLNFAATWIKCASVDPSRYYVTLIGQTLAAMSQIFILGTPPPLAAAWFSENDVSRACAVGVFGNQVGIALGFLIPPLLIKDSNDIDKIGHGLSILSYSIAGLATVIFIAIIVFFEDAPPIPPSKAQAQSLECNEVTSYKKSIMNLFKNRSYVLLLLSYGINTGVFYAISTLLNQALQVYYKGYEEEIGEIGLTIVLTGLVGSVLAGYVLDKTHKFKETTIAIYGLCVIGMLAYTLTISLRKIWVVFITAGFLGFFVTGYLPVGFEFAAEITYPEPEGSSSGLLNASAQLFGIIFTLGGSELLSNVGVLECHLLFCAVLGAGFIMTVFIKADLRRQMAGKPPRRMSLI